MKISDEIIRKALVVFQETNQYESAFTSMEAALEAVFDHIADINKMVEPEEKQDGFCSCPEPIFYAKKVGGVDGASEARCYKCDMSPNPYKEQKPRRKQPLQNLCTCIIPGCLKSHVHPELKGAEKPTKRKQTLLEWSCNIKNYDLMTQSEIISLISEYGDYLEQNEG